MTYKKGQIEKEEAEIKRNQNAGEIPSVMRISLLADVSRSFFSPMHKSFQ